MNHPEILIFDKDAKAAARVRSLLNSIDGPRATHAFPEDPMRQIADASPVCVILGCSLELADRAEIWAFLEQMPCAPQVVCLGAPRSRLLYSGNASPVCLTWPPRLATLAQAIGFPLPATSSKAGMHAAMPRLIGQSEAIVDVRRLISKVAATSSTVLINGEAGTGRELAARLIHGASDRSSGAFVPVTCGALTSQDTTSVLCGHVKDAFGSELPARQGKFDLAREGTLFLDDISGIAQPAQQLLESVLHKRRYQRAGDPSPVAMEARVIAATSEPLEQAVMKRGFREDLSYRLEVFPLTLPPLRERREDIPLLIAHTTCAMRNQYGDSVSFSRSALDSLTRYEWPGNLRELHNLIECLSLSQPGTRLNNDDLPAHVRSGTARRTSLRSGRLPLPAPSQDGVSLSAYLESVEKNLIQQVVVRSGRNLAQAAQLLHIGRGTLAAKMHRHGLHSQKHPG